MDAARNENATCVQRHHVSSTKLVNRKTRKALNRSVRKAMKKHGPTLLAGLASGLASSIATLAGTEAPGKHGKWNLADLVKRAGESLRDKGGKKSRSPKPE